MSYSESASKLLALSAQIWAKIAHISVAEAISHLEQPYGGHFVDEQEILVLNAALFETIKPLIARRKVAVAQFDYRNGKSRARVDIYYLCQDTTEGRLDKALFAQVRMFRNDWGKMEIKLPVTIAQGGTTVAIAIPCMKKNGTAQSIAVESPTRLPLASLASKLRKERLA